MRFSILIATLFSVLATVTSASAKLDLSGGPEMPKGYETREEVQRQLLSGKIPLIKMDGTEVADGVKIEKDIVFKKTDEKDLVLHLYHHPDSNETPPLVVFIHGGAWRGGKPADYHYYCIKFAELGYAVATVGYRFSQEAKFPAAHEDVADSIRWLRDHAEEYKYDADRIALVGGSAGGHLAMLVGYTWDEMTEEGKNPIKAVVDIYGPADLTTDFAISNNVVVNFFGKPYDEAKELYEQGSPIFQLDEKDPPTLIIHGTIDEVVPIVQSDMLEEKLKELEIPYHYEKFPGWPHTMDLAEPVNNRVRFLVERFLEEFL